jgi:hypothetical protein
MQTISKAHVVRAVEVLDELFPLMEVPPDEKDLTHACAPLPAVA